MTDYKEKYPLYSPWKCRDGTKAVIVKHEYAEGEMMVYHEDTNDVWTHTLDGTLDEGDFMAHDLIEPWKEPRTIEGWVNVYDDDDSSHVPCGVLYFGDVHLSEKEAVRDSLYVSPKLLKTIKISYTEGE